MRISKKTRTAAITVFVIMIALPLLIAAVMAVSRGQGMNGYQNGYGLFISSMSFVVFTGAFVLAILAALIARAIYYWRIKRGL